MLEKLVELWRYRELTYNLTVRDLKVRYKNSVLGIAWSLLNPLLMMMVFTLVYTVMLGQSNRHDYPVFILSGLLPWNFFSASIMGGTASVVGNSSLIKKVYFPRETLPLALLLFKSEFSLIALIVLGPDKLPETARKIGNVMGELRRMSSGFQNEMRAAMDEVTRPPLETVKEPEPKPDDPAA